MKRIDFIKSLGVLPFLPAVLMGGKKKPELIFWRHSNGDKFIQNKMGHSVHIRSADAYERLQFERKYNRKNGRKHE